MRGYSHGNSNILERYCLIEFTIISSSSNMTSCRSRSPLKSPVAALILAASTLSGCTMTGSTSFSAMSSAYREVVEGYTLDNMLINVVRSSERLPMSFLDMPSVIGTGSVTAGAGIDANIMSATPSSLAGFASAAAGSSYAPNANFSVNNGFNFTQSSLDNSSFMSSFLTDLKPEQIDSLTNNDAGPKSILYSLVIEEIELRDGNGARLARWVNDPALENYKEFQQVLYRLINSGLKTETVMQRQILSAPMDMTTLNSNLKALVPAYAMPGVALMPAPGPSAKPLFQLVRMMPMTRMCLVRTEREALTESQYSDAAFCNPNPGDDSAPSIPVGDLASPGAPQKNKNSLIIKLRSPRNVFAFLGTIVTLQHMPNPKIIKIKDSDQFEQNQQMLLDMNDESTSIPLFLVEKNGNTSNAIASVKYRGNTYSIPSANTSASREVLTLLSEILTLSKVPGSIPPSPAVLIK